MPGRSLEELFAAKHDGLCINDLLAEPRKPRKLAGNSVYRMDNTGEMGRIMPTPPEFCRSAEEIEQRLAEVIRARHNV